MKKRIIQSVMRVERFAPAYAPLAVAIVEMVASAAVAHVVGVVASAVAAVLATVSILQSRT